MLSPMKIQREGATLSGLSTYLILAGGFKEENLRLCEKYAVVMSKWTSLPRLNSSMVQPGCVVLAQCEHSASVSLFLSI